MPQTVQRTRGRKRRRRADKRIPALIFFFAFVIIAFHGCIYRIINTF